MLSVGEDSPTRYGSTQESEAHEAYALSEAQATSDYCASCDPRYSATHFALIEPRLAGISPLATRTAEVITQTAMTTNTNKSMRSVSRQAGMPALAFIDGRSHSRSIQSCARASAHSSSSRCRRRCPRCCARHSRDVVCDWDVINRSVAVIGLARTRRSAPTDSASQCGTRPSMHRSADPGSFGACSRVAVRSDEVALAR